MLTKIIKRISLKKEFSFTDLLVILLPLLFMQNLVYACIAIIGLLVITRFISKVIIYKDLNPLIMTEQRVFSDDGDQISVELFRNNIPITEKEYNETLVFEKNKEMVYCALTDKSIKEHLVIKQKDLQDMVSFSYLNGQLDLVKSWKEAMDLTEEEINKTQEKYAEFMEEEYEE